MTNKPIQGKVARILNSREVAINVGSIIGVNVGMLFDILDPKVENILDPDTQEILGSINRPKVRVKVTRVEDRLSLASTYQKYKVNIGGSGIGIDSSFAKILMAPKIITRHETLKTTEDTWEDLDESESYVKTGDPIIQVISEEDL